MKIVIDMNLSPLWVEVLRLEGYECVHWSEIGSPNAADRDILMWAKSNGYVVFLMILISVPFLQRPRPIRQVFCNYERRTYRPKNSGELVVLVFKQFEETLSQGALVSINEKRARARILPIQK